MEKHLISVGDLDTTFIKQILDRATQFKTIRKSDRARWSNLPGETYMANRLLITDFYEPSTRTRLSFEAAMSYLGGNVIGTENAADFSSAKKGESIADNFRVISGYCDIIVGRFKNEGDARIAAEHSIVPVINGGDGGGEHPTQALIDLFIILDKLKPFQMKRPVHVTFIGDNYHSRTVHSLTKLLFMFGHEATFVSKMANTPSDGKDGVAYWEVNPIGGLSQRIDNPDELLHDSDVVYLTRPQVERHFMNEIVTTFEFTPEMAKKMPYKSLIMHPLPRTWELPTSLDGDHRSVYFEQAHNGLYVRMALLEALCS